MCRQHTHYSIFSHSHVHIRKKNSYVSEMMYAIEAYFATILSVRLNRSMDLLTMQCFSILKISITILFYIVISEYCYSFLELCSLIERIIF